MVTTAWAGGWPSTSSTRSARRPTPARVGLGLLVGAAVVLSACGSSPSGGTAAPKVSKAANLALAKRSLVVLADLPNGWKASGKITAGSGSGGSNLSSAKLASCLGVSAAQINATEPTENSPTFSDPQGASSVDDQVEAFPSAADASTDFSTFSNAKTPGCVVSIIGPLVRQSVESGAGAGTTIGTLTATKKSFRAEGDQSGDIELAVPVKATGVSTTVYIDLVVITKGRLETTLTLDGTGSPVDSSVAQQVAAAAVRHMS